MTDKKSLICILLFSSIFQFVFSVNPKTCSESSCTNLGWTVFENSGICGESNDSPLDGCSGQLSYVEAMATCEEVGARLCSISELQNDITKGTGCNYDDKMIWTNTPCQSGKYNDFYGITIGSASGGIEVEEEGGNITECVSSLTSVSSYVRCCADEYSCSPTLAPTQPSPAPTITSYPPTPSPITLTPTYTPIPLPTPSPTLIPTSSPTAFLTLEGFDWLFVDKDRLEVSWTSDSSLVDSKIIRFELRLTHDDGSSWSTEFFQTLVTSAETYIFTGLTCNTKYRAQVRAVIAADDLVGPNGAVLTALHNEVYGPWYTTSWQRLLACYVASSPGGYDGLTLTKGNFAHRNTLTLSWITPTDDTNLDYFEIRYRPYLTAGTWSYTTARPKATSKVLYNDQHGTVCGTLYQVQIRSSGGHGDWAKGAWVEQTGRTKNCPSPTSMPTSPA